MLQAQRRAFEAHSYGTWEGLKDEIPTMINGAKLKELPLETPVPGRCTADPLRGATWPTTDTLLSPEDSKKGQPSDHTYSSHDITHGEIAESKSTTNPTPEDSSPNLT